MKKFIGIGLVVLLLAWAGVSYYSYWQSKQVPDIAKAPYLVQTFNRVFYARDIAGTVPNVTMKGYYIQENKRWVFRTQPITFNQNFPVLSVKDRRLSK